MPSFNDNDSHLQVGWNKPGGALSGLVWSGRTSGVLSGDAVA